MYYTVMEERKVVWVTPCEKEIKRKQISMTHGAFKMGNFQYTFLGKLQFKTFLLLFMWINCFAMKCRNVKKFYQKKLFKVFKKIVVTCQAYTIYRVVIGIFYIKKLFSFYSFSENIAQKTGFVHVFNVNKMNFFYWGITRLLCVQN